MRQRRVGMLAVDTGGCDVMVVEANAFKAKLAVREEAMPRPARSSGDDRPRRGDAAETAQGSRSRPRLLLISSSRTSLFTEVEAPLPQQLRAT